MGKRKTIVCLETGKQFNSVENAANAIGVSSGFISRQIKAGKPIKGFYYYYAGEMLPDEYRQKIKVTGNRVVSKQDLLSGMHMVSAERNSTTGRKVEKDE